MMFSRISSSFNSGIISKLPPLLRCELLLSNSLMFYGGSSEVILSSNVIYVSITFQLSFQHTDLFLCHMLDELSLNSYSFPLYYATTDIRPFFHYCDIVLLAKAPPLFYGSKSAVMEFESSLQLDFTYELLLIATPCLRSPITQESSSKSLIISLGSVVADFCWWVFWMYIARLAEISPIGLS